MESRLKLLGHPIHPMLVMFPVGLLATSAGLDIYALRRDTPWYAGVAHQIMGIGLAFGILAMVFGVGDWFAIPARTRAKRVGLLHGLSNVAAMILFGIVWVQRQGNALFSLYDNLIYVEVAGLLTLLFAGWLGGELVARLSVGVDDDANVNASNSLRRRPRRPA